MPLEWKLESMGILQEKRISIDSWVGRVTIPLLRWQISFLEPRFNPELSFI